MAPGLPSRPPMPVVVSGAHAPLGQPHLGQPSAGQKLLLFFSQTSFCIVFEKEMQWYIFFTNTVL